MTTTALRLLAATGLALAACNQAPMSPAPSGGSAGAEGPGYCETVPSDPADMPDWEQLCQQQGRR